MGQLADKLKKLPKSPGIYFFKDKPGEIVYIGKAKILFDRVRSYFQKNSELTLAKQQMIGEIADFQYIVVDSEEEALVLESIMVRRYLPKYNVDLRDDKSKIYLELEVSPLYNLRVVREKAFKRRVQGRHFGPYANLKAAREVIKMINRIFLQVYYVDYQLGLNLKKFSKQQSAILVNEVIKKIKIFLRQDYKKVIKLFNVEMQQASENKNYELAAKLRDQIFALEQIKEQVEYRKKQTLFRKELEIVKALSKLKEELNLPKIPQRIECYDISNFQGQFAVGSMVVFTDGEKDTDQYRKFKIKTVFQSNDVAMMKEVLSRRFKNKWPKPDLIIVDGGKPQLGAAILVLKILNKTQLAIAALAKREEEIFLLGESSPVVLEKNSPAYFLVQRIRDEAHRFAISYYRERHAKGLTKS